MQIGGFTAEDDNSSSHNESRAGDVRASQRQWSGLGPGVGVGRGPKLHGTLSDLGGVLMLLATDRINLAIEHHGAHVISDGWQRSCRPPARREVVQIQRPM